MSFRRQRPSKMVSKTVFVRFVNMSKQNCKKLSLRTGSFAQELVKEKKEEGGGGGGGKEKMSLQG